MNFIIAEFDHYEPIYGLLRCIENIADKVMVYTPERFAERLKNISFGIKDLQFIVADNSEDLFKHRVDVSPESILIIAPSSHFDKAYEYISLLKPSKTLLWIRNINFWFMMGTRYKVFKRPRSEQHKLMLSIANQADYLVVESDTLERYLKKITRNKYKTLIFPYSVYEKNLLGDGGSKLTISLPGYIEESRRDYKLALSVFSKLDKNFFRLKILGQARDEYGALIIEEAKKMISNGYDISFLDSPNGFEDEIVHSDVIFAPLNVKTRYSGVDEVYGKSKESGVTYDVIRFSKPAIFPANMDLPGELSSCVLKYETEDQLTDVFNSMLDKEYYKSLKNNAAIASAKYEVGIVSKTLLRFLDK